MHVLFFWAMGFLFKQKCGNKCNCLSSLDLKMELNPAGWNTHSVPNHRCTFPPLHHPFLITDLHYNGKWILKLSAKFKFEAPCVELLLVSVGREVSLVWKFALIEEDGRRPDSGIAHNQCQSLT